MQNSSSKKKKKTVSGSSNKRKGDSSNRSNKRKAGAADGSCKAGSATGARKVGSESGTRKSGTAQTRRPHERETTDTFASHKNSRCRAARECGACQYIDVEYMVQLAQKNTDMIALFADIVPAKSVLPIKGMEQPYYYRNKVASPYAPGKKLPSGSDKQGSGRDRQGGAKNARGRRAVQQREILCGMYAAGTHRIIATDDCLIENKDAKKIILAVRDLMPRFGITPYDEDKGTGFLRHVIVRVGHTSGEVLVTLVTNERLFPASKSFCRELVKRCPCITTVVQNINERQTNVILGQKEQKLYGPGFILDKLCGLSFRISSQSFYQVNAQQTEVLYMTAIELARLSGVESVIDAYCGTGTIGLVAAKHGAAQVIGVDSVESSIRDARENAKHNGVENAQFVVGDAGELMRDLAAQGEHVDVVLMDPPRAGSSEDFLQAVSQLAPSRVVYISCNPTSQVRDLKLLSKLGYKVEVVQPVDMFPHTDHVETVCLMVRENS